ISEVIVGELAYWARIVAVASSTLTTHEPVQSRGPAPSGGAVTKLTTTSTTVYAEGSTRTLSSQTSLTMTWLGLTSGWPLTSRGKSVVVPSGVPNGSMIAC